ncbi:glutamine synthetase family protein [Sciscionella marina]|uniref:glutamine synthetase family protein n=1 Tax=Sciscionella marina TaxID=508770 RepID=UPI00037B7012|nr:glutamine synthetase family protein [Sciscionella marina]
MSTAPTPPPEPDTTRIAELAEAGARLLVGTFIDNAGITRVKTVPFDRAGTAARSGIGLSPAFAVMCLDDHVTATGKFGGPVGDLRLLPDLSTATVIDAERGIAWAPLDQYDQELARFPLCQRDVLRRQEQQASELELAFLAAFEIEFTLLTSSGAPVHTGPGYGLGPLLDLEAFALDLLEALATAGVGVGTLHPEYGPGQVEISLAPRTPVAAVDQYVLARLVIGRTARRHGLTVSFAPVTLADEIGNGSHVHFSATQAGHNVFTGGEQIHGLTTTGAQLIAGVVDNSCAAAGVLTPTIASYERLQPGHWSGAYACWGLENREAAVRLIRGSAGTRSASANVEVKSIDGASNPYLVLATILGLGLSGVREERTLCQPVEENPDAIPAQTRADRGIHQLPTSLPDALDRLEQSKVLRSILGEDLVDCLVAVRRHEVDTYTETPMHQRIQLVRDRY